ncbi:MAG: hemolysin D [Gemmatimonadota bacterium]
MSSLINTHGAGRPPLARRTWRHARTLSWLTGLLSAIAIASCGGGAPESAVDSGDSSPSGDSAKESRAGGPDEDVVTLDSTALRLGGIAIDTVATITTSGLPVTGTITYDANRVSHVGSRTEGRITGLRAELGARVRRGQLLALLESPDVGQIRADEREAEELVKIAEENFAREQRLAIQGISSRKELLDAEAELRRMQASLRSARTRLQVLGAGHGTGGQFGISAPFAGVIVARDASVGEMASPADTLFTVADLSRVWIELDIFERDLTRIREGQSVAVRTAAYPDRTFEGRIVYVGSVLDATRRTVRARVEIPNTDGALKPGMFANASIQVGAGGPIVVVVPREAVQEVEGRQVVFVPGTNAGEFRTQDVEVGESIDGGRVTIRSGLRLGSRIVTRGAFALRSELAKSDIGEAGH